MRTFIILILFFVAFIVFVTNILAGVNLTSNSAGVVQAAALSAVPTTTSQPQLMTIQESAATISQSIALLPVTGECTNPYTVRAGDSLSQIAVNCNITLATIRQANPQIINANLIYPGQQLNIPDESAAQNPVTGTDTPIASLPQTCACDAVPVPVAGLVPMLMPGSGLQVKAIGFQPDTPVNIAIGSQGAVYTVVTSGVTDANGNLTTRFIVPTASDSQIFWEVRVSTTSQPITQASSLPFHIDP